MTPEVKGHAIRSYMDGKSRDDAVREYNISPEAAGRVRNEYLETYAHQPPQKPKEGEGGQGNVGQGKGKPTEANPQPPITVPTPRIPIQPGR